jgi:hypothetical protein
MRQAAIELRANCSPVDFPTTVLGAAEVYPARAVREAKLAFYSSAQSIYAFGPTYGTE